MRLLICLFLLTFTACAHRHINRTIFTDVHKGDNKDVVIQILGEPDAFSTDSKGVILTYARKQYVCVVQFENDLVTSTGCSQDAQTQKAHGNILGEALKGMGNGLLSTQVQAMKPHDGNDCAMRRVDGVMRYLCD